jgi:hypothetical protein
VSKTADELLRTTSRTDSGNQVSGDSNLLPTREPIFISPSLGDPNAPARIVGGMVSGMPCNDQSQTQDIGAVEKVSDSRVELPGTGRQL